MQYPQNFVTQRPPRRGAPITPPRPTFSTLLSPSTSTRPRAAASRLSLASLTSSAIAVGACSLTTSSVSDGVQIVRTAFKARRGLRPGRVRQARPSCGRADLRSIRMRLDYQIIGWRAAVLRQLAGLDQRDAAK